MSSATAGGKRKTDAAFPLPTDAKSGKKMTTINSDVKADPDASLNLFATIPDAAWEAVSAFASPPDVYQLCLSSAHFHTNPAASASGGDCEKKADKSKSGGSKSTTATTTTNSKAVLATRLLRSSLLSSLGRVLEKSESGITLESALEMADLPEGSALIAGSTMAAAVLGEVWSGPDRWRKADVDVFCTAKAAPQVRSWLVRSAGAMFVGFKDYRLSMTDDSLLYTVDTKIHHVEHFGPLAENFESRRKSYGRTKFDTLDEYVDTTSGWGKDCQKNYADWKWKNTMSFDVLGIEANNKAYSIKPGSGGTLPFDFDGDGNIDLVIAKVHGDDKAAAGKTTGKSSKKKAKKSEVTPFDILDDFDLTICKASFDGKTFRIPEPHLVFARKTTMEPYRRAIVESYLKHFPGTKGYLRPADQSEISSTAIKSVRKDVPNAPFYKLLDFAALIPDHLLGDPDDIFAMSSPAYQAKLGPPIQFHNWTKKLVDRLKKYQGRGIEVLGAPTVDEGVHLPQFDISPF